MDEEKSADFGIESAGECHSIPELGESSVIVGGEREDTASLEDKPVVVGGGAEDGRENHAAGSEPEFSQEPAAVMEKIPDVVTVDGGTAVIASEGGKPSLATEKEGAERVDCAEREAVVADGGTAHVADESIVKNEGDEPVIDTELEMTTEEYVDPVVDTRDGSPPVVGLKMEVVNTDAGYEHQLSEFQTGAGGDGLSPMIETTEAWTEEHERLLGDEENARALRGVDNESVDRMTVENNADAETATRCDEVTEEKGDIVVGNDLEIGRAEKVTGFEEEKGNSGMISESLTAEVAIEGSVNLVNISQKEQVHESSNGMEDVSGHERNEHGEEKEVAAEVCETKMVDNENLSMGLSSDAKLDEHVNEAENKDDVLVTADPPVGDTEQSEICGTKMVEDENLSTGMSSDAKSDEHLNETEYKDDTFVKADLSVGDIELEEESRVKSEICGTKMVEHEDLSMGMSNDAKIDEHLNEAEYKDNTLVKADLPVGDIEPEEESRVESELCGTKMVDDENLSIGMSSDAKLDIKPQEESRVESEICETKMVEGENLSMGISVDDKLDDHLNEAEYKDDALVEEDLPVEDIKPEEEHMSEAAEVETEMVTNSIDSKTLDDDGKLEVEDNMSDVDEAGHHMYDSPTLQDEEDETMVAEEETGTQDTEMETETDMAESGKTSGGKRKRAKLTKSPSTIIKAAGKVTRKTVGEDVCFICFDGGELVLCDRRGCPKAYHPSCVNRDEAFFKSKGRWNCGWHLCSICEKNARYMCYTCTFSLCKSCTKDAVILCVRGNKGFCETCMRTITLIENKQGDNDAQIDFDDRSSWEYLFKDYYLELKDKLSLSLNEIVEAKNPWKGAEMSGSSKMGSPELQADANDGGSGSDDSNENLETIRPKRRKVRRQTKSQLKKEAVASGHKSASLSYNSEWASRELLEFVSLMKNGDTSLLSQFDVQALLLEYIKINKLRDPRRKSQIVCDARLENLFGKPRVGHFEMLKLLESHFLTRDEQNDDFQGSVVDTENDQLDIDTSPETLTKGVKDKKRKSRKKGDRGPQSNIDDFAAIDMHNIGLIYLRRKLMEDLLEDAETFNEKVVGTFVRIRISGSNQKQDLYRLVQVVGTSKAGEPYKVGKKTTDTMVEILNLDKTEIISIDTVSNQEFSEDECKRLRQSIKCGLISRLTVGEILDKTMEIQVARVNDWLESETLRLSHLRDRASDLGRRKELRECVEKLQVLKTPEERRRRLEEIPEIHSDPKMDPNYESEDNDSENEDTKREAFMRSRSSSFNKRGRAPMSPARDNYVKDSWTAGKSTPSRNLSTNNYPSTTVHVGEILNESSYLERDRSTQESIYLDKPISASTKSESAERTPRSVSTSGVVSLPSQGSYSAEPAVKINESEKMWHYLDPAGKVQGPFSMVQLRKWNNTGYFPANLKIWRAKDKQENSFLLADALVGKFPKESPAESALNSSHILAERSKLNQSSNLSTDKWSRNDTTNLPSPTPRHLSVTVQSPSVNGVVPSPTAVLPTHSPNPASVLNSVAQNTNFSPTPNSQILVSSAVPLTTQMNSVAEPHMAQMHAGPPAPVQPVQTVGNQNPPEVWGGQTQAYNWATTNVQSSSGSFPSSGGIQSDVWRPPTQSSQPNMHSPTTPTPMAVRPQNPNIGWNGMQANPNMGWGNPPPGNTNVNWAPPMQVAPPTGNAPVRAPPPGGNNMQGMVPGNVNPGWAANQGWGPPPGQGPGWGPPSGNVGAAPPVRGPGQGNANQGWAPWGGEQSQGGGQFSGQQRGGGPPWNRQSSFSGGGPGGGGGGGPRRNKSGTLCPFNANGRCRKGARCDYLHN